MAQHGQPAALGGWAVHHSQRPAAAGLGMAVVATAATAVAVATVAAAAAASPASFGSRSSGRRSSSSYGSSGYSSSPSYNSSPGYSGIPSSRTSPRRSHSHGGGETAPHCATPDCRLARTAVFNLNFYTERLIASTRFSFFVGHAQERFHNCCWCRQLI